MKTLGKWVVVGIFELIFCFWLLDNGATLVSSSSDLLVWLGVFFYLMGLLILPGVSISYVVQKIHQAKRRQKELRYAFPDDRTSLIQLLDANNKQL